MKPSARVTFRVGRTAALALALMLGQIVLACSLSGQTAPGPAYRSLYGWDGTWYADIAVRGYRTVEPFRPGDFGNVAFFPGYPLCARILQRATGLDVRIALLLAAQLAAWAFWTYLLLLLERWRLPPPLCAAVVVVILCHPGSFFLVCSYSESLFLAAVLGFFYWAERPGKLGWTAAALHGIAMTGTRLVGVPLAVVPVVAVCLDRPVRRGRVVGRMALGACAGLGALAFFTYCRWQFGSWDVYMRTEEFGWKVHANYLAVLSPRLFCTHWPHSNEGFIDPEFLSRLCVPATLLLFAGLAFVEWRTARRHPGSAWRQRFGLYVGAALMFYVLVCGRLSVQMTSMSRYCVTVLVPLSLAAAHLVDELQRQGMRIGRRAVRVACLGLLLNLAFTIAMIHRFTHGKWVA
jgi:hypothetical protein